MKPPSLEVKNHLIEISEFDLVDPKLLKFASFLKTEGITRGLIGPKEAGRIWERHIFNCLPLVKLIPKDGKTKVADLGSGAGLPGLVVAIAKPELDLTLIEPLQRRVQFLVEAIDELGLKIKVIPKNSKLVTEKFDLILARAVAPLGKLLVLARPLLKSNGEILVLVGEGIFDQISELVQTPELDPAKSAQSFNLTLHKIQLINHSTEIPQVMVLEAKL